jgi:DNA-directed RNA polymerase subunit E'/Rpb7
MQTVILNKRICLHSKFLDQNIMRHILEKLSELADGTCSQEYGYILRIKKIIEILDHEIGRADIENIFNVRFEADILKPEKGLEMNGKVCMIYKDGIFINIMDKQKMLIPKNKLTDYDFLDSDNTYKHKTTKKTINIGDNITAVVTVTGYNNQSYSCFGCIV